MITICLILLNKQAAPTVLNGLINSCCYKQFIPPGYSISGN